MNSSAQLQQIYKIIPDIALAKKKFVYKRNSCVQLYFLRLIFIVLALVCLCLFIYKLNDYAYLVLVILCPLVLITISQLSITGDAFTIRQFYFFGLIPQTFHFSKQEDIVLRSFDVELGDTGNAFVPETLWSLLFFISSYSKTTFTRYMLIQKDIRGKMRKLRLKLSIEEYIQLMTK